MDRFVGMKELFEGQTQLEIGADEEAQTITIDGRNIRRFFLALTVNIDSSGVVKVGLVPRIPGGGGEELSIDYLAPPWLIGALDGQGQAFHYFLDSSTLGYAAVLPLYEFNLRIHTLDFSASVTKVGLWLFAK